MSLPLLRGASEELISSFLEKTNFEFWSYEEGDVIVEQGDTCNAVRCLISGKAEISHPLFGGSLVLKEVVPEGCFLGVERLFGMDNSLNMTVKAVTKCGTMSFSKQQYLKLLRSDNIFLMNCLNYLSRSVQKFEDVMTRSMNCSLRQFLAGLVSVGSMRQCVRIVLESRQQSLYSYFDPYFPRYDEELQIMVAEGIAEVISEHCLEILDRNLLVDSILES